MAEGVIDDGMGEFRIAVSSIPLAFLEAFRLRSEHAASINDDMRVSIATRLIEEYGSARARPRPSGHWRARTSGIARGRRRSATSCDGRALRPQRMRRRWIDRRLARRASGAPDSRRVRVAPEAGLGRRTAAHWQTTPGRLPPFIVSLLPEGWLEQVLQDKDECALLRSGKRYTSSITIVEQEAELRQLPQDAS